VGYLSADLLLCDSSSQVLAAIDVRSSQESERSRERHDRMARVLRAADIEVHVWHEGNLPTLTQVRALFRAFASAEPAASPTATAADLPRASARPAASMTAAQGARLASKASPLMSQPDISELLAEGDAIASRNPSMEPVPSSFFDELDQLPPVKGRSY
jgi:hypothetical protein